MLNTLWVSTRWAIIPLIFGVVIINIIVPDFYWDNELFHVLIESGGSIIGFGLALIVLAMIQKGQLPSNYTWLIACFISMGTLDMFHSQIHPGQAFVWLHSVATFIGGLFAMLIWLPESTSKKYFKPQYFWAILTLSIGFSVYSIIWPESTPKMLDQNRQFTLSASALNVIGGIGFMITWFYFAREYHRSHHKKLFFFSNHFCLFGVAGLIFEISLLWDGNWWFWHMMRAFAYILLMFHFSSEYRKSLLVKIEQSNKIFDQTSNELYMFDKNTLRFTEVNIGARNNLGYSLAEMKEMTPVDINPEFTKEKFTNLIAPLISGHEKKIIFRTSHQRKDGTCYPAELHLQLTDEEPYLFFAIGIDITESIVAEEESRRLQNELLQSQKMESLGQLTGGVAHDFNNLLAVISGFSQLTIENLKDKGDDKLLDYLDNITDASDRATSLVQQMLAFSRGSEVENISLSLSSFLADDIKMLRSTLPSTIEIVTDIAPDLPNILINTTQLHQILMNLSINARDAMSGVGKITIRLSFNQGMASTSSVSHKPIKGDWIELSVSDTGSGIDPNKINYIFDPFFTTKEVGKGTGMGLSVIYRIMENHGGHIILESELGKGTTFRLLFSPITDETEVHTGSTRDAIDIPRGDGSEILVVDDEPMLVKHMSELLKNNNYKTHCEIDSTEALKLFKNEPERFSLVITDQTMPKMSGIELIEKLRMIRPGLPIVMNSGYSDKIDEHSASELDINYMSKPVDANKLLITIASLISLNQSGR